ncbi:MAG: TIGR00159 family protein [Bdellovibrio sp.]|nr:TIGR00159 family protein [Bdellovibrio sp.]
MGFLEVLKVQLGLKDLIDMAIVTVVVYQCLVMSKGTRAVQIMIGVAILSLFYWLGAHYEFHTLNWFLNSFFDSIIIILVILFQDQIRSVLASMAGQGRIFGGLQREKLSEELDEVIEAIVAMAREKIGALIVFERAQGLGNFIETGTILQSKIHSDLIYAIFQSKASIHDGAMVVSDGQIAAVGCYLPLARNIEIDRHYGTRHRAAIGVTEVTDAVVIVVSEETGQINLCLNGALHFVTDAKKLRIYLKHLWAHRDLSHNIADFLQNPGVGETKK